MRLACHGTLLRVFAATGLSLSLSSLSYADCDKLVAKVIAALNYSNGENDGEQSFTSCKIWPAEPSKTIVALAHFQKGSSVTVPPSPDMGLYDLDVLVVDSKQGKILQHLFQKGELSSDSISLKKITIDTAPYIVTRDVRAFGVRASFVGFSAVSSWEHEQINLYIARGERLIEILKHLVVGKKIYEDIDECANRSVETVRTLAIGGSANHGYSDLIVQEKTIERHSKMIKNACVVTEAPSSRQYMLRFDGNAYLVSKELQ